MFGMCDVWDAGCSGYWMFEMRNVGYVGYWVYGIWSGCGMFRIWGDCDVECLRWGRCATWSVRDAGCLGCEMFDVRNVYNVGHLKCGIFGM